MYFVIIKKLLNLFNIHTFNFIIGKFALENSRKLKIGKMKSLKTSYNKYEFLIKS